MSEFLPIVIKNSQKFTLERDSEKLEELIAASDEIVRKAKALERSAAVNVFALRMLQYIWFAASGILFVMAFSMFYLALT